jgi:hypothetical protein
MAPSVAGLPGSALTGREARTRLQLNGALLPAGRPELAADGDGTVPKRLHHAEGFPLDDPVRLENDEAGSMRTVENGRPPFHAVLREPPQGRDVQNAEVHKLGC